jgi:hypothetical protein
LKARADSLRSERRPLAFELHVPDFAIGRQLREGLLVTVLDDHTDRSGPLRILWPSSRHLAPKLRVFVDFLVANLGPAVEGESDKAVDSRISS